MATKFALIVGTDFLCWMPIIIMGFLSASGTVEIPADVYAWAAVFILPLNSALNPFLYTFAIAWKRHKHRSSHSSVTDTSEY